MCLGLVRHSFYSEALDIGRLPVLLEIASEAGIDAKQIQEILNDGSAAAALMSDYLAAQQQDISGSPSWVMNNGR